MFPLSCACAHVLEVVHKENVCEQKKNCVQNVFCAHELLYSIGNIGLNNTIPRLWKYNIRKYTQKKKILASITIPFQD